jgi:hypothetical protein
MLVFNYESKKVLKEQVGKPLRYIDPCSVRSTRTTAL